MGSLLTSASGLDTYQFSMDVIADNVANVNTIGYKSYSALNGDQFYNTLQQANALVPVNIQEGLGVQTLATPTNFGQGAIQNTGVAGDVAIQGNGFFVASGSNATAGYSYTREGQFTVDSSGFLRTPDGQYINGVGNFGSKASAKNFTSPTGAVSTVVPVQIPSTLSDGETVTGYSIGNDGGITVTGNNGGTTVVGNLVLANFENTNGLTRSGDTYFLPTLASGSPTFSAPGQDGAGSTSSAALEASNVNLSTELSNMIINQQAFDANAKGVTVADQTLQTAIGLYRA